MPYKDLQSFLRKLEQNRDLHRVKVEVDPTYEITEIAIRAIHEEKPALAWRRRTLPEPQSGWMNSAKRKDTTRLSRCSGCAARDLY